MYTPVSVEMENGMKTPTNVTIKGILGSLMESIDEENKNKVISLGMGDPTAYSCFTTNTVVQDSVAHTLESQKFNGYSPTVGLLQTRKYVYFLTIFFQLCLYV